MQPTTDVITPSYERSLRLRKLKPATIHNYLRSLRAVETALGKPAHEASTFELEELFERWSEHYSDHTRLFHWLNLGVFFKWAVSRKLLTENPLAVVPRPEISQDTAPRVLNEKELKALLKSCKGKNWRSLRDEAMIRCLLVGMRNSECRLMKVADIDWLNQLVTVTGKTGTRTIYLGDKAMDALERYMHARAKVKNADSEFVWLTGRDNQAGMVTSSFNYLLRRRAEKAGIGHVVPKSMRHSAVDRAHRAGVRKADANRIFGWSAGSNMYDEVYSRQTAAQRALDAAKRTKYGEI